MKLEFLFVPTSDLAASLRVYRDVLGFTELWREGETTVALAQPGSDVQIMLDANEPEAPVTPLFVVDSAREFHALGAGRPHDGPGAFRDPRRLPRHLPGRRRYDDPGHGPVHRRERGIAGLVRCAGPVRRRASGWA